MENTDYFEIISELERECTNTEDLDDPPTTIITYKVWTVHPMYQRHPDEQYGKMRLYLQGLKDGGVVKLAEVAELRDRNSYFMDVKIGIPEGVNDLEEKIYDTINSQFMVISQEDWEKRSFEAMDKYTAKIRKDSWPDENKPKDCSKVVESKPKAKARWKFWKNTTEKPQN
jgi:hypothetical protein